jgi:threonine dehydrogenase-like Zn-dependent dehydrogenase
LLPILHSTGLCRDIISCEYPSRLVTDFSPYDLVYKLPDSVDLVYGAMMEPLSVAVHAVANKGQCRGGMNVLIMGAGPVGLLAMGVAKGMGARTIVAVDINEERLNFAKSYAATHTYIPVSCQNVTPAYDRQSKMRMSLGQSTRYGRRRICLRNAVSQPVVLVLSI